MSDGSGGASRRQFLAATAALAGAGAFAGCQQPDETITADHVGLSDGSQDELGLTEGVRTTREMRETTSVDETETLVAIENAVTAYGRVEREPTLIESFAEGVAPTPTPTETEAETDAAVDDAGNALAASLPDRHGPMRTGVVVPGTNVGIRTEGIGVFAEEVSFEASSFFVPEVARAGDDGVSAGDGLALLNPPFTDSDPTVQTGGFSVPVTEFFPDPGYTPAGGNVQAPDAGYNHLSRWFPDDPFSRSDDFAENGRVLVVTGERGSEETFGRSPEEMPGERLREGDTVATGNNPFLMAVPGDVVDWPTPDNFQGIFDAGYPVAMGGETFGLGALVTPEAEVGGEQLNGLLDAGVEEFLASDQGRELVGDALPFSPGVPDYDLQGVTPPEDVEMYPAGTNAGIVNEEIEIELYGGVVEGENGPWWIGIHAVRAPGDGNTVFAVGTHVRPISSTAGPGDRSIVGDAGEVPGGPIWTREYIAECGEMAAASVGRLELES